MLQEKAMEQWIELSNWRSELTSVPLSNGPFRYVLVRVDIVNKTSFPVTLKQAQIEFITAGDKVRHTYSAGEDTFLAPNAPYEVVVATQITDQQVSEFALSGIGIQIVGRFDHIGSLKKLTIQEVSGLLMCQQSQTVFIPQLHMNPKS